MAEPKYPENKYDVEAWTQILKEISLKKIEDVRPVYDKVVEVFPTCGRFWKQYIEHEMKVRNYGGVEKLFQRCLQGSMIVRHVDLWKCYLHYIRETKGHHPAFRERMAKAYEFALDHIGLDHLSYSIWVEYAHFVKNVEVVGSYQENQKITGTRRIYQNAITTPMAYIEQLWKDYVDFEKSVNDILAEKMVNERSKEYMNARRVAKEYESKTRALNRNLPATPPTSSPEEIRQLDSWRRYIAWEKSNPLKYEDSNLVVKRVVYAYEQCLLVMGHHPDVWYEYASYLEEHAAATGERGDPSTKYIKDAATVYERATSGLLKDSILLHFAYADFEESRNRKEKVTEIYNRLLSIKELDPTLVYIQYMRFARRCQGIKDARIVFKKAREDPRSRHHVYTAAAQMEFYVQKERNVACKIFELGLKKFPAEMDFILAYIDFLMTGNDENNTKVVFERIISSGVIEGEKSVDFWNRYLEFETNIGDLSSVTRVEERRAVALEKSCQERCKASWLVDRYRFLDLLPCSPIELRSLGYDVSRLSRLSSSSLPPSLTNGASLPNDKSISSSSRGKKDGLLRPDLRQMIPFKPIHPASPITSGILLPIRGGVFAPPPAVLSLMTKLPPPECFRGPFVELNDLFGILITNPMLNQDRYPRGEGYSTSNGLKFFETAIKASAGRNSPVTGDVKSNIGSNAKRSLDDDDDNALDGDNSNSGLGATSSVSDIYRNRKIKNVKT